MGSNTHDHTSNHYYLPDFCNVRMVLYVVIIGELLAFLLTLRPFDRHPGGWDELSLISLFIQWVSLSSAWLLCVSGPRLRQRPVQQISLYAGGVILGLTAVFSELAIWVPWHLGLSSEAPYGWHWQFLLRNLAVALIAALVLLRYFYLQFQWQRQVRAESRARLEALQARIRPHFLFNSMNTIASLIREQPAQAEEAVEDLADLFRHSLADASSQVSLEQELEITRRYVHMEQLRLGERLQVTWDVDSALLPLRLPALLLQPLVENAIYHGIEPLRDGGSVSIVGRLLDGQVELVVTNPVATQAAPAHNGNRIALENIQHRLQTLHGARGQVRSQHLDGRYSVTLSFPAEPVTA